jgi:VanZ family protein
MAAARRFAAPLLLMALIYFLSAQSNLDSGLGGWDLVLRKLAHMAEFGTLFALWWRALRWRAPLAAAAITLAYAATDEYHQSFVAGRAGAVQDVAVDALGVCLAYIAVRALRNRRRRRLQPA